MSEPRFFSRRQLPLFDDELWRWAMDEHPILKGFNEEEEAHLRDLALRLMKKKQLIALDGVEVTPEMWLSVAVQACLPILRLGYRWYRDWGTLYLVPEEYEYSDSEVDEAGVVHEISDTVSGQTMPLGSVVLSVADVEASGWGDGYNVVIHEMAHVIDRQNGRIDGAPPLHRGMDLADWTSVFTDAYVDLQNRVVGNRDRNRARRKSASRYRGVIDPYAAEAPEEFFAVVSELFFESPSELYAEYPAVYGLLREFFKQDPLQRLSS